MVVPGLVTSAAGLLLLLPPTRAAARPRAGRDGCPRHRSAVPADHRRDRRGRPISTDRARPDYIDGEVIDVADVTEVDPPALPLRPE